MSRGGCLEASSGVHHVAERERLPRLWPGSERHDGLAGVDGGSCREVEAGTFPVQVFERGQNGEPGPDRSFGVVAVGYGRPEHRHDGVADELLEDPAVPLDLLLGPGVVALERLSDVLRVGLVGSSGEAHEVNEQHRDQLPLLGGNDFGAQRRAAVQAEPGPVDVVLSAPWTGGHAESVGSRGLPG
jgi:hypothetical protein